MSVNCQRLAELTKKHGGEWAVQHAERLIRLVELIGEGLDYDREAIRIAAYLHDWGTFPRFARDGALHARRSREMAEEILLKWKCAAGTMERALEAIEFHHGGADERSIEAVLIRDADALDGIGIVGLLREFAQIPTRAKGGYALPVGAGMSAALERAKIRMENNPAMLRLSKAREIARDRVREMREMIDALERETFGCL
jgi:uncharacterized protein